MLIFVLVNENFIPMHLKKSYLSPVSVTMEIKLDSALLEASDKWCLGLYDESGDRSLEGRIEGDGVWGDGSWY